jgi:hypothetical protein
MQGIHPPPIGLPPRPQPDRPCASPLDFYLRFQNDLSADDFALVASLITTTNSTNYIEGRINVNTASAAVLASLPGISDTPDLADTLVNYRQTNPNRLTSIAWVADALSGSVDALDALRTNDCITTRSYQFSADIAALGPHGRGYQRVRFVFDTSSGAPQIVYRQDLTRLGWALGKAVRQKWVNNQQLTDNRGGPTDGWRFGIPTFAGGPPRSAVAAELATFSSASAVLPRRGVAPPVFELAFR